MANIYARKPIKYLKDTLGKLMEFKRGHVILMGDGYVPGTGDK